MSIITTAATLTWPPKASLPPALLQPSLFTLGSWDPVLHLYNLVSCVSFEDLPFPVSKAAVCHQLALPSLLGWTHGVDDTVVPWLFHTRVVWVVIAPDDHRSRCLDTHGYMLLQVFHNYFLSICSLSFLSGFFHRSEVDQFGEVTHLISPLTHRGVNSYLCFSQPQHPTCLPVSMTTHMFNLSTWRQRQADGGEFQVHRRYLKTNKQTPYHSNKQTKKPCHHVFLYFFLKVLMGLCFRFKFEIHF